MNLVLMPLELAELLACGPFMQRNHRPILGPPPKQTALGPGK